MPVGIDCYRPLAYYISNRRHLSRQVVENSRNGWSNLPEYAFIENSYNAFIEKKDTYGLTHGLVDSFLEGLKQQGYLEMRGVKLAVAAEIFVKNFTIAHCNVHDKILSDDLFDSIRKEIRTTIESILEKHDIGTSNIERVLKKIPELNRMTFNSAIKDICKEMNLPVCEEDVKRFIKNRNSLIHKGSYSMVRDGKFIGKYIDEYLFMVNFLNRMQLKLLDYSGLFITWHYNGVEIHMRREAI